MAVKHLFTDEEIRNQLKCFGYSTLPEPYFQKFKADLMKLIEHESDKLSYSSLQASHSDTSDHECLTSRSESSLDSYRYNDGGLKSLQINHKKYNPGQSSSSLKLLKSPYMDFYMDSSSSGDVVPLTLCSKSGHSQKSEEESSPQSCVSTDYSKNQPAVRIRKTLRKRNGVSQICEEAIIPKTIDVENMCDELESLALTPESNKNICSCENSPLSPKFMRSSGEQCCHFPKSFLRPNLKHYNELRKDDPVNRFHKYNKIWKGLKVPGQEQHKNVCWRIRERMLYPDIPITEKKSAPSHISYNYAFSSIKKQAAWEVRSNLAFGNKKI